MSTWDMAEQPDSPELIAIVGMAGRFPQAPDLETFWHNLKHGIEGITFFSDAELIALGVPEARVKDPNFVKAAPILTDIDQFDAAFFGYTPGDARLLDPQQRLFLELSWHALEHAAIDPSTYQGTVGVFGGTSLSTYLLFNVLTHPSYSDHENGFEVMVNNDKDFLCTRVAYHFDLRGPSLDVQTGCSTSLVATHLASEALMTFQCDVALAGGVSINVPQRTGYLYEDGGITSPDGHCRAFDAQGQGTLFGSGGGVVVLKRLSDAIQDGDTIHAVLLSSAINNDGSQKLGYTAPSVAGQAEVVFRAKALANISADSIGYIEAHGTATSLGDPVEIAALSQAFRSDTEATQFCAIGSVKTNIGHLDAAAGIAGLIKTVLALKHNQIPPSLHFTAPNPSIDFAGSPFFVNTVCRPWPATGLPRRAGVSSFGIGGTNAHVLLQEAPALPPTTEQTRAYHTLVLSARTESALEATTQRLQDYLRQHPTADLSDVAYTLQVGRRRFAWRRAFVCRDLTEALSILETRPADQMFTTYREHLDRPVVFMFPGVGAQYINMGRELYSTEPVFRAAVDRCSAILQPLLGYDLCRQIYPERADDAEVERLNAPSLAMSALFTVEYALAQLLLAWGITPTAMVGHSLGEYVAASLAGVMSLNDALATVVVRGRLLEELPAGAMLSVLAPAEEIQPLLGTHLSLAAINSPAQCVVSGTVEAIEQFAGLLAERDIDCQRIKTHAALHSHLAEQILPKFVAWMKTIPLHPPSIPFVSSVSGTYITDQQATDPYYWGQHLRQTVQFKAGVAGLLTEQEYVFLEVGPGSTLSTLVKAQAERQRTQDILSTLGHPRDAMAADRFLIGSVGKLWAVGVTVDWQAFYGDERRRRVPLPGYPFERQSYWIDPHVAGQQTSARSKQPALTDWFHTPSWQQTPPPLLSAGQLASAATWLVFAAADDLSRQLVDTLERSGQSVVRVVAGADFSATDRRYQLHPGSASDYEALVQDLHRQQLRPDYVLYLWSLHEAADFVTAQRYGYNALIHLARAWHADWTAPTSWWVVGQRMHRVESQDIVDPNYAIVSGPCRVIPQEYPQITCYSLDIGWPTAQTAQYVLADVLAAPNDRVLAYRGRQRWRQDFIALPLAAQDAEPWPLRRHGVYLITGGLGTLGLQWAAHLAQAYQARLALVARSSFPARQSWPEHIAMETPFSDKIRQIQALEAAGAEVLIIAADVASEAQLRMAIDQTMQHFDGLSGIIHAAGIAGSKAIKVLADFEPTDREPQFLPKVYGTYNLSRIVPELALDFVLLVSSNVAIFGGVGLTAYGAANAFLDAFVTSDYAQGARWYSLNLDHLQLGTAPKIATTASQYTLSTAESIEVFQRVVTQSSAAQVIVSAVDLPERWQQWVIQAGKRDHTTGLPKAGELHPRPQLETAYVAPSTPCEQMIAEIWQQTLGVDQIGVEDNFFLLGGDSLLAIRVTSRLRKAVQVDVPVVSLYEALTVRGLAAIVADLIQASTDSPTLADSSEGEKRRAERHDRLQQQRARRRS